ncbi:MAG: tetratricopeptide repeat protein [Deltaproteobacteria bacterium]|nr:tetratricopeptide repeat protein [Deltaproteobacteria bacterium]
MKRVLVLFTSILLFCPLAGLAAETGYVVGHVSYKMTMPEGGPEEKGGMPGMAGHQSNGFEIEIACVKDDYSQRMIKAGTDKDGYFYLADQPLDGLYRVTSIQDPDFPPIPIIVPPPDLETDATGNMFIHFSSRHEANAPIIDIGETIVEIFMPDSGEEASTRIIVEREYGNEKAVLDSRKEKPFDRIEGHYGYPGLEYYASSGPEGLQRVAQLALEDRQQFDRAEYVKEEADQLRENDREAAIIKYREAVQNYPAYLDAWDALVGLLTDMERKEEAVSALEEAMQNCPSPGALYVHCRLAAEYYMAAGDSKKAIPLYEKYLSLRPDNSWAIVHLAKAYIADSRFEDAYDTVNQGNKSVIYYAIHYDFEKANRISVAKEMLQKAISTYSDGSLSKNLEDIKTKWASLP